MGTCKAVGPVRARVLQVKKLLPIIAWQEVGKADKGIWSATVEGLPQATSNPLRVSSDASPKVAWGDCHCHTAWADGTGTLDYNVTYARDEAFLDVFGFAEHLCPPG